MDYPNIVFQGHDVEKVETMQKTEERLLTIKFNADTAAQMRFYIYESLNSVLNINFLQVEFPTSAACGLRSSRGDCTRVLHS